MPSLAELYGNFRDRLSKQHFGPDQSYIWSTINDPRLAAQKAADWLNQSYASAGNYDPYSEEAPIKAIESAIGLSGLMQTGAMPFAPSGAGTLGSIKASHGSPHAFDKFDFSKIGTGEGAQAYGHGGYFAEGFDSPVAQKYAKDLANIDQFTGLQTAHANAKNQIARFNNDPEWAAEVIEDTMRNFDAKDMEYSSLADTLKFIKSGDYAKPLQDEGHLYNVELKWPDAAREASDPLGEHHLLDWDAPIAEQSDYVRTALHKAFPNKSDTEIQSLKSLYDQAMDDYYRRPADLHPDELNAIESRIGAAYGDWQEAKGIDTGAGSLMYHKLAKDKPYSSASKMLLDLGIPGIRYLDQGSRATSGGDLIDVFKGPQGWHSKIKVTNRSGAGFSAPTDSFTTSMPFKTEQEAKDWATSKIGAGTRNYVMFDDQFPNIVSRNGASLSDLLRR